MAANQSDSQQREKEGRIRSKRAKAGAHVEEACVFHISIGLPSVEHNMKL